MGAAPTVHRFQASAFPVNAYLVETENGVIAVDSTMTVSDGRAIRARIDALGKPLIGAIVTHAHPDHYGALVDVVGDDEVPIIATAGVDRIIRRDDPVKEQILRPMFGDEWPRRRLFPNRTVADGERVTFDGVDFVVTDLGPGESPHDSIWSLEGDERRAFAGDLAYNHMHAYLADGFHEQWLQNIARARAMFEPQTVLYIGHGEPASPELLDWQAAYIRTFLDAVRSVAATSTDEAAVEQVTERMKAFLATDDLLFLMQLSVPAFRAAGRGERHEAQ
jgi:glyoxylase-like metal-dependent hydrolase (beta-lactamase superfamily II)